MSRRYATIVKSRRNPRAPLEMRAGVWFNTSTMTNKTKTDPATARAALNAARHAAHELAAQTAIHACAWRAYIALTDETPSAEAIAYAYHAASSLHNYASLEYVAVNPTLDATTRAQIIAQCTTMRAALDTYTAR